MARINSTTAFASEQATVSNTALDLDAFGFTAAQVLQAERIYVFVNSNAIRVWWDGSTPTTSDGIKFEVGFELVGDNIRNLSMIRDGASDAEVAIILES